MNTFTSEALPSGKDQDEEYDQNDEPAAEVVTPDGEQEIKWEVVSKTAGLIPAQIIADRLQSEGVPARAWQEGAGQAFGLTVGLLGTGYVIVPETYVDQARDILTSSLDDEAGLDEAEPYEDE
jgi:hypothetical protein